MHRYIVCVVIMAHVIQEHVHNVYMYILCFLVLYMYILFPCTCT